MKTTRRIGIYKGVDYIIRLTENVYELSINGSKKDFEGNPFICESSYLKAINSIKWLIDNNEYKK